MRKLVSCLVALFVWALLPAVLTGKAQAEDKDAEAKKAREEADAKKAKIEGLKVWLKLDETEGKKAKNSVEKGAEVEVEGAKWVKEGKFEGALSFNGESDYAITATSVHESFTEGNVTIAVWINPKAGGVVVDELGQHTIDDGWHDSQIEVMDDGEVKVRVWQLDGLSIGKVKLDEWHHVVMRYDAKSQTLDGFVDGVKSADKITGEKQWNGGGDIYYAFGVKDSTNLGQGGYFKGLMDDIRVYNKALSDEDVKTLADVKK